MHVPPKRPHFLSPCTVYHSLTLVFSTIYHPVPLFHTFFLCHCNVDHDPSLSPKDHEFLEFLIKKATILEKMLHSLCTTGVLLGEAIHRRIRYPSFCVITRTEHSFFKLLRGYCTSYPKISMFCAVSQNYQHLFEKIGLYASYSKLSKELKNTIKIKVGQVVLGLLIQTTFWLF